MKLTKLWNRHKRAVEIFAKSLDGTIFNSAPFDIIGGNGEHFYEVKCPSDRRGRHKGECRITITEDEQKFGELFSNRFTIIILFNGVKYNIPFSDLKERIMRNRVDRTPLGGVPRIRRQVTLGKSFLKKYESL